MKYLEVLAMFVRIQKWENSAAIRIAKEILEMADLNENDRVKLRVKDGNIILIPVKKHIPLADRIVEYEEEYGCEEWDVGAPRGKEQI